MTPDALIIMHRDAHFGGNFETMIQYYQKGGKGVSSEFDLEQILEIAETERLQGVNASLALDQEELEWVDQAKASYKSLKELYKIKTPKVPYPKLIADLILSEDEEPQKEIEAIVAQKSAIVPHLIKLIQTENFYNPLFPGYGKAPQLAAFCLGKIGDKRAIISLFEAVGQGDFFDDEVLLDALNAIGSPAKEFLLHVLHAKPITEDNERAAIALIAFKEDKEVAQIAFQMLKELDLKKEGYLATYLIFLCEGLKKTSFQEEFQHFMLTLPKDLQKDCQVVLKEWNQ